MTTTSLTDEGLRTIRDRIISSFLNADCIYVDTCTLIEKHFSNFVKTFGPILLSKGKKLIIIHQVRNELKKLAASGTVEKQLAASQALQLIEEQPQYFQLKKEFNKTLHADRAFCKLLAQHCLTRNQILLTEDYNLTAAIYNLSSCDTDASSDHCTRALTLMNGPIPRQRTAKQLRLDSHVEFSFWPLDAQPVYTQTEKTKQTENAPLSDKLGEETNPSSTNAVIKDTSSTQPPKQPIENTTKLSALKNLHQEAPVQQRPKKLTQKEYFEVLVKSSSLFMTRAKLIDIFIHNKGKQFIYNLHDLYQRKVPVVIRIMKNALDSELEAKMASWKHLFQVCHPLSSYMSETHALLSHIGTSDINERKRQNILISDDEPQFELIRKRLPACHVVLPLMRGCISPNGDLHSPYKRQQYALATFAAQNNITA